MVMQLTGQSMRPDCSCPVHNNLPEHKLLVVCLSFNKISVTIISEFQDSFPKNEKSEYYLICEIIEIKNTKRIKSVTGSWCTCALKKKQKQ